MSDAHLTDLERRVLGLLLAGDDPVKVALRVQLDGLVVTARSREGPGAFTNLAIAPGARALSQPRFIEYDIFASNPHLEHGGEFILFVADGALSMLEGVAYTGVWPETDDGFEFPDAPRIPYPRPE